MRTKLLILIFLLMAGVASGAIIYVATDGSDDTGDGSSGNPYLTASYAYSQSNNNDTINMVSGNYTISTNFDLNGSTGVTFQESGGDVTFDGTANYHFRIYAEGITIDGFEFTTGNSDINNIRCASADNVVIKNNTLLSSLVYDTCDSGTILNNTITNANSGNGTASIWLIDGSDNNLIENNTSNNSSYWGIEVGGAGGQTEPECNNNTIRGNIVLNASRHGIKTFESGGIVVENNWVEGSTMHGLHDDTSKSSSGNIWKNNVSVDNGDGQETNGAGIIVEGSDLVYVYNNSLISNGTPGIYVEDNPGATPSTNVYIKNNIAYENGASGIGVFDHQYVVRDAATNNIVFTNNILYDSGQADKAYDRELSTGYTIAELNALSLNSNNLDSDPTFDGGQYALTSGSPAENAGVALTDVVRDYRGKGRSNPPEIGAMEIGGTMQLCGLIWNKQAVAADEYYLLIDATHYLLIDATHKLRIQ